MLSFLLSFPIVLVEALRVFVYRVAGHSSTKSQFYSRLSELLKKKYDKSFNGYEQAYNSVILSLVGLIPRIDGFLIDVKISLIGKRIKARDIDYRLADKWREAGKYLPTLPRE